MEVSTVIITLTVAAFVAFGYFLYRRRKQKSKGLTGGSRGSVGRERRQ